MGKVVSTASKRSTGGRLRGKGLRPIRRKNGSGWRDYAILLDAGYSRARAFALNALSASTCAIGAAAVWGTSSWAPLALPYILAFAAGSFLYVAMSDLIPGLHRDAVDAGAVRQVVFIAAGIGTIIFL